MKRHETGRSSWCWGRVGIARSSTIRGSILCYAPAAMKRQSVRMMLWYVRASPDGAVSDGAVANVAGLANARLLTGR